MPLTGYANPSVAHHLTFVLFASVRVVSTLFLLRKKIILQAIAKPVDTPELDPSFI
jgi:hypothetical protein